jgi:cytochrome c
VAGVLMLLLILLSFQTAPPSGRTLFDRRCGGCHALDRDKEGPRLGGVLGRRAGTVPSFEYSQALKKSNIVWNAATLDKWLSGPTQFVPGADMGFYLDNPDERRSVIAFLIVQRAAGAGVSSGK